MTALELVVAGIAFLLGIRSLVRWVRTDFDTTSFREQVLFTAHVTARVGLWFAFGAFFVGYALIDDVGWSRWYVFVLLGLAAVQLFTTVLLGRTGAGAPGGAGPGRAED